MYVDSKNKLHMSPLPNAFKVGKLEELANIAEASRNLTDSTHERNFCGNGKMADFDELWLV